MTRRFEFIGLRTLLGREIHRFLRLPNQTLLPPIITASLYIVIFGFALSKRISPVEGISYELYIIPGLIMMSIISASFGNTSSSVFSARFQGFIQELLVSPMSNFEIVLAIILGGVVRGIVVGAMVTLTCIFLADVPIHHPGPIILFAVSVATIFSCAGFISAMWAQDFDRLSVFQNYVLTPLTYLGGVFFSVNWLDPFWQNIARVNPVLYFVNGLRYGFLGVSDVNLWDAAGFAVVVAVGLFLLCYHLFRTGYNIKT